MNKNELLDLKRRLVAYALAKNKEKDAKINAPNLAQVKASYMGYLTVAHTKNNLRKWTFNYLGSFSIW